MSTRTPPRSTSTYQALFDGKTLNGWKYQPGLWSVNVDENIIIAKSTNPVLESTYCLTNKDDFTDFRLLITVKLVESEMHSGISFWGYVPPEQHNNKYGYAGHLVMFPSFWGVFDLLPSPKKAGAHVGRNLIYIDPGKIARKTGKQHDWNELEILAKGNHLRVACNGVMIVDWKDPEPERIRPAPIGLQLHSNNVPQEVHFKNIYIEEFPSLDELITVNNNNTSRRNTSKL